MALTTSERIIVDEAAHAAAKAAVRDVLNDITRIVENAVASGDERIVKLLDDIANAQVSATGSYAATLKSELAAARKKNDKI